MHWCYIVLLFTFIIKNLAKLFVAQVEMIQNCNFIAYKTAPNLVTSAGLLDAGTDDPGDASGSGTNR